MSATRKIIVITDSYLLAAGIECLALEIKGLLVEEIFSGKEKKLTDKVLGCKPDFLIMDPEAMGEHFISFMNELNEEPDTTVIGLVKSDTPENIKSHFAYLLNRDGSKKELITDMQDIVGKSEFSNDTNKSLSNREIDILKNLVLGMTNQEVADKLFLSVHTVTTHRKKITKKLGIKTVSGLTVYALINNFVDIREVERRF